MRVVRCLATALLVGGLVQTGLATPAAAHERYETPGCGAGYDWHSSSGQITGNNPDISRVDMYYNPYENAFCGINRRIGPADGTPGRTFLILRSEERVSSAGGIRSHYAGPTYIKADSGRCTDVGSLTDYGSVTEVSSLDDRTVCGRPPGV
jgi:hypothetical protein